MGAVKLLSPVCRNVPVIPAGGLWKTPCYLTWNMGGKRVESPALSPKIFGFQLNRLTSGGRGFHIAGKFSSCWYWWANRYSCSSCLTCKLCVWPSLQRVHPFPFLPPLSLWQQMLSPKKPTKQKKTQTLKLWLLNCIDKKQTNISSVIKPGIWLYCKYDKVIDDKLSSKEERGAIAKFIFFLRE